MPSWQQREKKDNHNNYKKRIKDHPRAQYNSGTLTQSEQKQPFLCYSGITDKIKSKKGYTAQMLIVKWTVLEITIN